MNKNRLIDRNTTENRYTWYNVHCTLQCTHTEL